MINLGRGVGRLTSYKLRSEIYHKRRAARSPRPMYVLARARRERPTLGAEGELTAIEAGSFLAEERVIGGKTLIHQC